MPCASVDTQRMHACAANLGLELDGTALVVRQRAVGAQHKVPVSCGVIGCDVL